ncbi:hypothetical protein ACFQJ5_10080 [Halomicroarcula sp. GCM10025324]|uniref:hypothetical protein n=1 Tax=Haloarcula TaxID=2237 RepID=UPI0023E7DCA3|nr:hypothetical protein [Halomicroarcula sp. ZS-22-S1]
MLGDSNAAFANSLQDSLDFRMQTFQEVLMGEISPLDRRLELAGRRPGIVFGATGSSLGGSPQNSRVGEDNSIEEPERVRSGSETSDNVEVEVESPSEDELRVANFLAEEHSEAETIALSSEDTIEVREAPGGTFVVDVAEVLEREFGEDSGSSTQASSVPSMSTAVAEKLG